MLTRPCLAVALVFSLALPVAGAQKRKLRDRGPISCTGIGKKVVKNARIRGDKFAVAVMGACKIVVRDSVIVGRDHAVINTGSGVLELINTAIESPKIAVGLTGTGVIRLRGSTVAGGKAAVEITGTGVIKARQTVFRGRKVHTGPGRLELDARSRWEKGGAAVADPGPGPGADDDGDEPVTPSRRELRPHAPIQCSKSQEVELANVVIRGTVGVMASGSCTVKLRDSEIIGSATGLMASGSSDIALINTDVSSPKGLGLSASGGASVSISGGTIAGRRAYDVSGGAEVSARGVTVRGRGTKSRTAVFKDLGGNRFLKR